MTLFRNKKKEEYIYYLYPDIFLKFALFHYYAYLRIGILMLLILLYYFYYLQIAGNEALLMFLYTLLANNTEIDYEGNIKLIY